MFYFIAFITTAQKHDRNMYKDFEIYERYYRDLKVH